MTANLYQRQVNRRSSGAGFGRMLILSFGLHLTIVFLFAGVFLPRISRDVRPLYYVDLVNLPVRDPQAGRPEVRPVAEKKPQPAPTPPAAKTEAPAPPKPEAPKPPPVAVKAEAAKAVAKAPAKPEPKVDEFNSAIERMRENQAFEKSLAALKAADARQNAPVSAEAPLGMPTAKGKEAGPDEQAWIQKYLKECWNFSKYQTTRRDLQVKARLVYDGGGQLIDYKIVGSSGNSTFDESVRRAILKAKQLPFRPERRLELEEVEFNLKELLD